MVHENVSQNILKCFFQFLHTVKSWNAMGHLALMPFTTIIININFWKMHHCLQWHWFAIIIYLNPWDLPPFPGLVNGFLCWPPSHVSAIFELYTHKTTLIYLHNTGADSPWKKNIRTKGGFLLLDLWRFAPSPRHCRPDNQHHRPVSRD